MSSDIFNQQLTIPLASEAVIEFFKDESFWQKVWQATTITNSGPFQVDLQSQLKVKFFFTPLKISQSLPYPNHPCRSEINWSNHQLRLNYHLIATSSSSSLVRFSGSLDKSSLLVQTQAKLILRHHWQQFVSVLHQAQHEFLFQNLQNNPISPLTSNFSEAESQSRSNLGNELVPNRSLPHLINQPNNAFKSDVPASTANLETPKPTRLLPNRAHHRPTTTHSPLFAQPSLSAIPLPTLGFALWKRANDWQKSVKPIFATESLTASQWLVLYFLVELSVDYSSLTASQLAKLTGLHKMVISDLAKHLVKKHYLRKLKLSHNKKEYQLQITAAGKTTAFAVFGRLQQAEKDFFKSQSQPLVADDQTHPHLSIQPW